MKTKRPKVLTVIDPRKASVGGFPKLSTASKQQVSRWVEPGTQVRGCSGSMRTRQELERGTILYFFGGRPKDSFGWTKTVAVFLPDDGGPTVGMLREDGRRTRFVQIESMNNQGDFERILPKIERFLEC